MPLFLRLQLETFSFFKLRLDAPLNLSIIRPTSGADETKNSLIIKGLDEVSSEEALRFSGLNRQR